MNNKEPDYVYILTRLTSVRLATCKNPSFRKDWVKIGKSSRPVDVSSKELANTAVPLPFEKRAQKFLTLLRPLLFCWLLINNQNILEDYYKSGIFILDETGPSLLEDVITYVCTKKRPPQRQIPDVNPDGIILEDYPNEQFPDTYTRLFLNKYRKGG